MSELLDQFLQVSMWPNTWRAWLAAPGGPEEKIRLTFVTDKGRRGSACVTRGATDEVVLDLRASVEGPADEDMEAQAARLWQAAWAEAAEKGRGHGEAG